jgi:hypothetical protein
MNELFVCLALECVHLDAPLAECREGACPYAWAKERRVDWKKREEAERGERKNLFPGGSSDA